MEVFVSVLLFAATFFLGMICGWKGRGDECERAEERNRTMAIEMEKKERMYEERIKQLILERDLLRGERYENEQNR